MYYGLTMAGRGRDVGLGELRSMRASVRERFGSGKLQCGRVGAGIFHEIPRRSCPLIFFDASNTPFNMLNMLINSTHSQLNGIFGEG